MDINQPAFKPVSRRRNRELDTEIASNAEQQKNLDENFGSMFDFQAVSPPVNPPANPPANSLPAHDPNANLSDLHAFMESRISTGNFDNGFDGPPVFFNDYIQPPGKQQSTEFASACEVYAMATDDASRQSNYGSQSRIGYNAGTDLRFQISKIESLRTSVLPTTKAGRIVNAMKYYDEDDLIGGLIDIKVEFAMGGMTLFGKPTGFTDMMKIASANKKASTLGKKRKKKKKISTGNASGNTSTPPVPDDKPELSPEEIKLLQEQFDFQKLLEKIQLKWELNGVIATLLQDWFTTDTMILYWKTQVDTELGIAPIDSLPPEEDSKEALLPGLLDITSLRPCDVQWNNELGQDNLYVKIPVVLRERIQFAINIQRKPDRDKAIALLLQEGVAQKYIDAVKAGLTHVLLLRADGDNWLVRTKERKHFGMASPSMFRIFISNEIRKSFRDGDFGGAFMFKHFFLHAKLGESVDQGVLAGQRINWATKDDTQAFVRMMGDVSKVSKIATNHTVAFSFVYPPADMFSADRYSVHTAAAFNWSGVASVLYGGEGGKYSSGYLNIRRLINHLLSARQLVREMFCLFFGHSTLKQKMEFPENTEVSVGFDENSLKEPAQLLSELKFMFENGMGDPQIAAQELGRDPDRLRRSKLQSAMENDNSGCWNVITEPVSTGNEQVSQANAGRPTNDGNQPNESSRTQSPPSGGKK